MGVPTIVCFGDSLFEGYGLSPSQALPAVLERLLDEEGVSAKCVNLGISGDTAEDGLDRIKGLFRAKPDLAIVEFGANDFFLGLEPAETEDCLAEILTALAKKNIPALLVGVRCLQSMGEEYKAEFDQVHPRLAKRFSLQLLPDVLATYIHDPSMLLLDGTHPNAAGVHAMTNALLPLVLKSLATLDADDSKR